MEEQMDFILVITIITTIPIQELGCHPVIIQRMNLAKILHQEEKMLDITTFKECCAFPKKINVSQIDRNFEKPSAKSEKIDKH